MTNFIDNFLGSGDGHVVTSLICRRHHALGAASHQTIIQVFDSVFLLRNLSKKVGNCAVTMIMIEVKIRGTQSIYAQKHIIAEVAFSRPKLWRTRVSRNTASVLRQPNLMDKTIKIPESI